MHIDRRAFRATLGTAAAINAMPSEALADALEHHMIEKPRRGDERERAKGSARHGGTVRRALAVQQSPGGAEEAGADAGETDIGRFL